MKKLFLLFAMSLTSFFASADLQDNNYIEQWDRLTLIGNQLSSTKTGGPVQLKGWSSFGNYGENCVKGSTDLARMKGMGANCVRLARYLGNTGVYQNGDLESLISAAKQLGMYVVLDWHILEAANGNGNPLTYKDDAKKFFSDFAKFVTDKGYNHVIYELCNEPSGASASEIKQYAEYVIPAITQYEKNKPIIIVGTPHWDQYIYTQTFSQGGLVQSKDANIMYAFHLYANEPAHADLLNTEFLKACEVMPVFVSEWGVSHAQPEKYSGDKENDVNEDMANRFMSYCNGKNCGQIVSWMNWSYGNKLEGSSTFKNQSCEPGDGAKNLSRSGKYIIGLLGGEFVPDIPKGASWDIIPFTLNSESKEQKLDPYTYDKNPEVDSETLGGSANVTYYDANNTPDENFGKSDEYDPLELVSPFDVTAKDEWNHTWDDVDNPKVPQCYAGRAWCNTRYYECVDVTGCAIDGKWNGSTGLGWVSSGEWLLYTFQVDDPGYYSIEACVGQGNGGYGFATMDEETEDLKYTAAASFALSLLDHPSQTFMVNIDKSTATSEVAIKEDEFAAIALSKNQMISPDDSEVPANQNKCWTKLSQDSDNDDVVANNGVLFKEAGTFVVKLSFANGFKDNFAAIRFTYEKPWSGDGYPIEKNASDDPTSVDNNLNAANGVYPTVVENGQFNVNVEGAAVVTITNMTGAVVYSQSIDGASVIKANLAAGSYNVSVVSGADVINARIIVK